MAKKTNKQGQDLVEIYEEITCLKKAYQDLRTQDLEVLSAKMYNAIEPSLIPKRKVLLNELLDAETELRVRNNA